MIILIVKIIIFIVILILVFNFTLKKYSGKYIDNYSEVMNYLYYSRNPDKDKTGIHSNEKEKELTYEEYKYLVLENDLPPSIKETNQNQSKSTENESTSENVNQEGSEESSTSSPAPGPSEDSMIKRHECDVCSSYTELDVTECIKHVKEKI